MYSLTLAVDYSLSLLIKMMAEYLFYCMMPSVPMAKFFNGVVETKIQLYMDGMKI